MKLISAAEAMARAEEGALLVDVREAHEHNAEAIGGSLNAPLSALPAKLESGGRPVIFYCQSGARTIAAFGRLRALIDTEPMILQGGLLAWKSAGFPTAGGGPNAVAGANLLSQLLATYGKGKPETEP